MLYTAADHTGRHERETKLVLAPAVTAFPSSVPSKLPLGGPSSSAGSLIRSINAPEVLLCASPVPAGH